jgi:general secretion pathway protein J
MKHQWGVQRGFTLLEVLVALGIVALIGLLSWRGLDDVLRSAQRVVRVDDAMQTLSVAFNQLERDLALAQANAVALNPTGLVIQTVQRSTGQTSEKEEIHWVLEEQGLVRSVLRENSEAPALVHPPIAVSGMQIRLWIEPSGWSTPMVWGAYNAINSTDLALQGSPLRAGNPNTAESNKVRAVEVSLTQPNAHTVVKLLLTGGAY